MSTNDITINVTVPMDKLRDAIMTAVDKALAKPTYGNSGGTILPMIEETVKMQLTELDLTDLIQRYARNRLESVVDEVVTAQLKERAKAKARELARNNQLFSET
jgi:transcriptional regulator of NAD metabolism